MLGIRDEYAPKFGRQVLTLWEGAFASQFVGWARELPRGGGFMVAVEYGPRVRVECESPRTSDNYERVDAAIAATVTPALDAWRRPVVKEG